MKQKAMVEADDVGDRAEVGSGGDHFEFRVGHGGGGEEEQEWLNHGKEPGLNR